MAQVRQWYLTTEGRMVIITQQQAELAIRDPWKWLKIMLF